MINVQVSNTKFRSVGALCACVRVCVCVHTK
uniref:Uncharacterized protein n=1 Tax=Anguilla anguilla TaxID=7936 RepID=A0A0E9VB34_ANGAN